jgi:hypothetical protein
MSTAVEPVPSAVARERAEPQLIPVLGPQWAFGLHELAVTAAFALLFIFLNHVPLRGTDLWGHVVAGRQILDTGALPTVDPILPLADGMRVVDLMWLSQVTLAAVERWGGAEALVGLFTLVVWLTYLLIARACYLETRHAGLATIVTAVTLNVGWNRLSTIRPENFAMLFFAVLLWLLVGHNVRRRESIFENRITGDGRLWLGVPLVMGLWANMHGSFPCGIVLLGCYWLGQVIEAAWQERSIKAVLLDREMRRRLYWLELGLAATLVNPYGVDAWLEAIRFSSNPNLADVLEWQPLSFLGVGGREFTIACVLLTVALRHSRRRVTAAEVLLLLGFGILATMQVRMTGWFAALWGVTIAPHVADVCARWFARGEVDPTSAATAAADTECNGGRPQPSEAKLADDGLAPLPEGRSFRYTLGCVGLVWIAFAFSTFARPVLGGAAPSAERIYESHTPRKLTAWMRSDAPIGQIFNPQFWGDWIAWDGPPGVRVFASTNIHQMPRGAWIDYRRICEADDGWETLLGRYHVDTVVLDKADMPRLVRAMKGSSNWKQVYDDEQAIVYRRRTPHTEAIDKAVAVHAAEREAEARAALQINREPTVVEADDDSATPAEASKGDVR